MIFFPEEYNVHLCKPTRTVWVVQPSEQQMDQPRLVQPTLDFCMGHFLCPPNAFLSCEMTVLTMLPFIFPFLMSSQTSWIALLFPQGDLVSGFHTSHNKNQTKIRPTWNYSGIWRQRDMMQWCFNNWIPSTVHSIMVYRNPITTNCCSKHEHLARNDSTSFTLSNISFCLYKYSSSCASTL